MRAILTLLVCLAAVSAAAQTAPAPAAAPRPFLDLLTSGAGRFEQVDANHWRWTGNAEIEPAPGIRFFADEIELFIRENELTATGNVVFTNPEGQIAAESAEFNLGTGVGTFHQASGIMTLKGVVDRAQFANQDPDVYFYGETIEKLTNRRYRIARGGFTTCVQPTPRWEVTSGNVVINLDDYAVARNMLLRVKGVPLFYLPIIYYPIQDDDRATGFLLPTYGASTLRGQSLSNAFFWAINRSQDATLFHDWYTRTGQGLGGEYRYMSNLSSSGTLRYYRFSQHTAQFTTNGKVTTLPASTSQRVQGALTQTLGPTIRMRARVDYFTDIITQQLYQQNVAYATQPYRVVEAGMSAGVGRLSTSLQYLRSELFSNPTNSFVYGNAPRLTSSLAPQMLFGTPIYASVNADYAYLPNRRVQDGLISLDNSLGRVDIAPALRVPLSRLTYLSVNTSATQRTTYYTRSLNEKGVMTPEGLVRNYTSIRTDIIGPVLTKIWDTPDSQSTERMKHVIEPTFGIDYITTIQNQARVPPLTDVSDTAVGGAMRATYGLNNRLFYRSRPVDGGTSQTREFATVGIQQTYYTDALSSRSDSTYQSASARPTLVELSPVALNVRVSPTARIDASTRLEYDVAGSNGLQVFTAGTTAQLIPAPVGAVNPSTLSTNVAYSRTRYGSSRPASSYLSLSTTAKTMQNRVSAQYALNWNISAGYIYSQSVMGSYLAQCCGVQADFQTINYPSGLGFPIPSDRRFNFSFVLAGLGTFSNFFGAFGQR